MKFVKGRLNMQYVLEYVWEAQRGQRQSAGGRGIHRNTAVVMHHKTMK